MITILGANGVIASELSRALASERTDIRQVSRNPKQTGDLQAMIVCAADFYGPSAS